MKQIILIITILLFFPLPAIAETSKGVPPVDEWNCPKSHPIKGNINAQKGTMIYHFPSGSFYHKTKPERCYSKEKDAIADGFLKSKR